MSKNRRRIIAGASMLGGLAVMAAVFSIQLDPLAWTRAGTAAVVPIPVVTSTPSPSPLPTSGPPPADPLASNPSPGPVIELPPVRITASRSKPEAVQKREGGAAEACSERRDAERTLC